MDINILLMMYGRGIYVQPGNKVCVYFYMTIYIDKNCIYIYMIYDIYLILYTQSGNPANLLEYIAERGQIVYIYII